MTSTNLGRVSKKKSQKVENSTFFIIFFYVFHKEEKDNYKTLSIYYVNINIKGGIAGSVPSSSIDWRGE